MKFISKIRYNLSQSYVWCCNCTLVAKNLSVQYIQRFIDILIISETKKILTTIHYIQDKLKCAPSNKGELTVPMIYRLFHVCSQESMVLILKKREKKQGGWQQLPLT